MRHPRPGATAPCPNTGDFFRNGLWAPDGSMFLAQMESHQLHLYDASQGDLRLLRSFRAPSPILDVCWFGLALEDAANTGASPWCFAVSCRDLPVRLVSASDMQTRMSYGIINHVEALLAPNVLLFSPDHTRVYGGLCGAVAVFPLSSTGNNQHMSLILSSADMPNGGQRGVVSALAAGRAFPALEKQLGEPVELLAIGTFSGYIGIYITELQWLQANLRQAPLSASGASKYGSDGLIEGQNLCIAAWRMPVGHGIHQLEFHPKHSYLLFVSPRRSQHIYVYDTRYLCGSPQPRSFQDHDLNDRCVLAMLERPAHQTHQRIWFGQDAAGEWIASGDQTGTIRIWSLSDILSEEAASPAHRTKRPTFEWQAAHDAISSASFSPADPSTLLTTSGGRHWDRLHASYDCDASDQESGPSPHESFAKLWTIVPG